MSSQIVKMAIFVEGLTERLLVERLLYEIAGRHNIHIRLESVFGRKGVRRIVLVSDDTPAEQRGYVLIRDCHGDDHVGSDIRDNYDSLVKAGYSDIIGLRDLFPKSIQDLPILLGLSKRSLNYKLKTLPVRVKWIIAVMEIEAWFLAEHTHFTRIHKDLDIERIVRDLGFDPRIDDMENRNHPASDLNSVYNLEGQAYDKTKEVITRTINSLDIAIMYSEMKHVKSLERLIKVLDNFITSCNPTTYVT